MTSWTTPYSFTAGIVPTAAELNAGVRDDLLYVYGGDSDVVTATAPFASTVALVKVGNIVTATGGFSRSAGSSTSFVAAGTVPSGFRPADDNIMPVSRIWGTTVDYQVRFLPSGVVQIRMSGADTGTMNAAGLSWSVV